MQYSIPRLHPTEGKVQERNVEEEHSLELLAIPSDTPEKNNLEERD